MNLCWEMPCCKCGGSAWYNCCKTNCCCPGMKAPSGPEWEAAKEGLKPFLDEAVPVVFDKGNHAGEFEQAACSMGHTNASFYLRMRARFRAR